MKVTKEYLAETRKLVVHLREMAEDVTRLKEKAASTPSRVFSNTRVQAGRKTDPMAERVVRYIELEELYTQTYNWFLDRNSEIQSVITGLPFREQLLVIRYYLCGESVPEVCDALCMGRSTFYRYLRSALRHIEEID